MEANELRIGNLLIYEKTTHEVTSVDGKSVKSIWRGNQRIDEYDDFVFAYEPIPLTAEWFNRLGFQDFKTDYGIMLNTPDRHLVVMPVRNEFYPCIEVESEFSSGEKQVCHLNRIEFVHELQNLYYTLTKMELVLAVVPTCQ